MIQTLRNAWRIPELRKKLLFTLFILFVYRFGSAIPVPFFDAGLIETLKQQVAEQGGILSLYNMMSGGAFTQGTIFALSIQPYINASIIMQLLTVGIPALERLQKEGGEEGRKKIASITRYATVGLGVIMGFSFYTMLKNQYQVLITGYPDWIEAIVIIATFTAGTALIMWLGEQITEFGIGNGISIILFASIISRGPDIIRSGLNMINAGQWYFLLAIIAIFLVVIAFVVFMNNSERRIPVQYAKRVVGRKMYGGQSTHLPLKVNMSGVMPIIFAQAIASFPATIVMFMSEGSGVKKWINDVFDTTQPTYAVIYFLLIIAFSYFYTSIQFNPIEIANNLKQNGGFIPGFRPGRPTSDFIKKVLGKITLFGAIFLGVIAVLPIILGGTLNLSGLSLGGTSVLIVVGVALETVKQIEAQMMMRHYKGFLE